MIRIQIYSLSVSVVYVETIRVEKHKYKNKSISAKLFEYSEERLTITDFFNIANKTKAKHNIRIIVALHSLS